ncbi:MAG: efflux RND transporter periplasmic adaptor subunit [Sulfuricaulis sp.]|uniref:efflux RND transporter periplasmic adaptor subunit n=1 Tax=Sulfuricaulis sp. TaxID=2003553 RepID=UPI0025EA1C27|nr:HlyD family efflux transporter periplasmic adaptor subunit [Sulfuricaulis sp.]MCR4347958.1 efflux RND transporter periplasmic adaptor subunit [Sulfuricaulis sp.]
MSTSETIRKYRWVIGVVLLIALGTGAYLYWYAGGDKQPAYREVGVTRGDLEVSILSTGVVQPRNRLEIKPPIAGRAEQVLVQEGQSVTKGQIMAWMSSTERAALIDAARARGPEELKRWEELYRATPVLAPINGTVILRSVEPGQTFTGSDAVFVLSDRLTIKAQVDETDIARIRLRQNAQLMLDAYPDQPFDGQVDQIAYDAKAVNNVTTYEVDVLPEKTPAFMRSGMTANVSFVTESRQNVLLVPAEAVKMRDGNAHVLLSPSRPNGKPEEKRIRTGLSDGRRTEILEGMSEGEKLLVERLRSGSGSDAASSPLMPYGRKKK